MLIDDMRKRKRTNGDHRPLDPQRIQGMRDLYMTGALCTFRLIMEEMTELPDDEAEAYMTKLDEEIKAYFTGRENDHGLGRS